MNKLTFLVFALLVITIECKRIETNIKINNISPQSLEKLEKYILNLNPEYNFNNWYNIYIYGNYYGNTIRVFDSSHDLNSVLSKMDYLKKMSEISVYISFRMDTKYFTHNVRIAFKELIETFNNECGLFICDKNMELLYYRENILFETFKLTQKQSIIKYIDELIENQNNVIF